jgi:hypothetical protein
VELVSAPLKNFAPNAAPGGSTWNAVDWYLAP